MSNRLMALHQRKAEIIDEMRAITDLTEMDEDSQARFDELDGEVSKVEKDIAREKKVADLERTVEAVRVIKSEEEKHEERAQEAAKEKRFSTFGEQLQAIAFASQPGVQKSEWDERLISLYVPGSGYRAAASGNNEKIPSEGGFLVQTDYSTSLLDDMHSMGDVLSRVNRIPLSENSNTMKLPAVDETSRVDGSRWGGVRGYWADEAATVTATKPTFRELELSPKKLFGLGYATEEMLQDSAVLDRVLRTAFLEELTFKAEDAIINGTGSGQPLGIMNAACLVSVTADSGQTAATITTSNILNMWKRMPARSRQRAVWYINQDTESQLYALTLGTDSAAVLLYTPPGARGNEYGLLMGRPVIPVEYCATLGTSGDIILADMGSYLTVDKGGTRAESSMHVRFLYDEMTYRFITRIDGQPAYSSAITPYKGSNTQSPFVALATRS